MIQGESLKNEVHVKHLSMLDLESGLDHIRRSPTNHGALMMIVRRPRLGERERIEEGRLDLVTGLVGDNWSTRGSSKTKDGTAHPDMQVNIMNARAIALVAQDRDRWALAGDQLFLDLNLSAANLPAGARLAIGSAILEVTSLPHAGCGKFLERFGPDALKFVNSEIGRELRLRGLNARVVQAGVIRVGDIATKR